MSNTEKLKDKNLKVIEAGDFVLVENRIVCQAVLDKKTLMYCKLRWSYGLKKVVFDSYTSEYYAISYLPEEVEVITYNEVIKMLRPRLGLNIDA